MFENKLNVIKCNDIEKQSIYERIAQFKVGKVKIETICAEVK